MQRGVFLFFSLFRCFCFSFAPDLIGVAEMSEADEKSIGQKFADKVESNEKGLGPAFVEKVEAQENASAGMDFNSAVRAVRGRAGTATESIGNTLSRLSTTITETAQEYAESMGVVAPSAGSLQAALFGVRAKDVAVPGLELVSIDANARVGELELLLRKEKIHSVPVFNSNLRRFEGVVDTTDLLTWAVNTFPKAQLGAWETFREEKEFVLQPVQNIVDASWRNSIHTALPDVDALTLLDRFRHQDVHRVFLQPSATDKTLSTVVTQSDVARFLNKANFDLKSVRIGEKIHSKKVVSCYEGELVVSAFRLMDHAAVDAVAVTDEQGKLVGALSSFDVVSGAQESIVSLLFETLGSFLKRDKVNSKAEVLSVRANDTFAHTLQLMATKHISHIFIIDDDSFPTGIITIRDIVEAFLVKN